MHNKTLLYINIVLTVIILVLIFYFSSRDGEQTFQDSSRIVRFISGILYKEDFSEAQFLLLHNRIRQFAHIILYVVLGFVVGLWVQLGRNSSVRVPLFFLGCAVCTVIGFADEWFKQYIPGRHYHVQDFLLNTVSAMAGLLLCVLVSRIVSELS